MTQSQRPEQVVDVPRNQTDLFLLIRECSVMRNRPNPRGLHVHLNARLAYCSYSVPASPFEMRRFDIIYKRSYRTEYFTVYASTNGQRSVSSKCVNGCA